MIINRPSLLKIICDRYSPSRRGGREPGSRDPWRWRRQCPRTQPSTSSPSRSRRSSSRKETANLGTWSRMGRPGSPAGMRENCDPGLLSSTLLLTDLDRAGENQNLWLMLWETKAIQGFMQLRQVGSCFSRVFVYFYIPRFHSSPTRTTMCSGLHWVTIQHKSASLYNFSS